MVGHAAGQPSRPACAREASTAESHLAASPGFRSGVKYSASGLVHPDQHPKGLPARCAQARRAEERRARGRSPDIENGRSRAADGPSGSQGPRTVGGSNAVGPRPGSYPLPAQNLDWTGGGRSCFPDRGHVQVYLTGNLQRLRALTAAFISGYSPYFAISPDSLAVYDGCRSQLDGWSGIANSRDDEGGPVNLKTSKIGRAH